MPAWTDIVEPPQPLKPARVRRTRVSLGGDTYNTCNPGVGDVDGDGLDELAVPVIENGRGRISLYRGDGSQVWRNDDVRFFHDYYGDPGAYRGSHWHPGSRHRHLFTHIFDIDGDGAPEVIFGDGPVWVLDGRTGSVKAKLDLDAHVQVSCPARLDGPDAPRSLVAGIESRDGFGSAVAALGASGVAWLAPVDGRSFEDAIWAGDVDRDGCDEIIFSPASTRSMFLIDRDGRVRWSRRIEGEIGDDTHVDDLLIDAVLPGGERQILMATGPALLDEDGAVLWTRGERYHHAQRILALADPDGEGKAVYFCESFRRRAVLLDCRGRERWRYDGFQRPRTPFRDALRFRLTTAGGLADWFGTGDPVIVQAETAHARPDELDLDGHATCYVFLLSAAGDVLATIPFEDRIDGWGGAMCARSGCFVAPDRDALAVITHSSSRLDFFACDA
jgi:hypothetical protein